jgi:benzoate-CoA ligase family protein
VIPTRLNLAAYLLDARLTEGRGDRIAIRTDGRTFTYAEVAQRSAQVAHLLAADGVRPEERVIVAAPDGVDFVAALFGILRHGSVVVMVNPDTTPELIRYFLEYTRATAAFVPTERLGLFQTQSEGLPSSRRLYPVGSAEFDARLAVQPTESAAFDSHRDDAAIWLFSGGTDRPPEGRRADASVVRQHDDVVRPGVLGIGQDDITISVPKLFFGYATGANLFFPFSVGASCVLFPERCTADALFAQIARHRPTVLINVPTMIQQMVSHEGAASADLSSLRLATSAGEPLPLELHERWMRAFGVELLDGLGTAEMWHIFISNRPGDVVPGTLGRVVPGFEVKLCDADGREVAGGEIGALWVKGESRAIGYWRQMDDTMRVFRGEWCVTGDMLQRNADGTFVYSGRSDDLLKVHGRWLAPSELENCLLAHPAVREVAVVAATDANGLVSACAFVVSPSPSDALAEELKAFARERLDRYKSPRDIVFVDAMPRTHLDKVDRGALAKRRTNASRP